MGKKVGTYRLPTKAEMLEEWESGKWKSLLPQAINRPKGHVDEVTMIQMPEDSAVKNGDSGETGEVPKAMEVPTIPVVESTELDKQAVKLKGSKGKKTSNVSADVLVNAPKPAMPTSGDIKIL